MMLHRIFLLITAFLVLFSCRNDKIPADKKIFRYNESANITTLDPAFARDQAVIWAVNQIYNGLVQLDSNAVIRPCIARNWSVSPDGLIYTFTLRNDVYFHNNKIFKNNIGRKVVASDFIFSLRRLRDPMVASPGAWVLNPLDFQGGEYPIYALNDTVLIFRLSKPFPPFLSLLGTQYCSVVPREAILFYGQDFRNHPVGTGPFCFKMWKEGIKLVLERNPGYFEYNENQRLPFIDAVVVSFIPDKQTAFLNFLNGQLDFISGIDAAYKDELLTRDGKLRKEYQNRIKLSTQPYLNTEYLGWMVDPNKNGKMFIPDKRIRQAINFSFDRKKMIAYLRNNIGTPGLQGIIPKGLPSFDSSVVYYDYNPEKSRQLLRQSGYPQGKGLPPVTLVSTPDYLDICKYIQHEVHEIGVQMEIEVSTPAAVKEMKAEAKLGFFRASWIADYPDGENYLSMFITRNFCPGGPNYTHFSDPRFDELYQEAMITTDEQLRINYYRQMETIMMEQSPVIILYYDQVLRFVQKNVSGLSCNPMNLLVLKYVKK